VRRRFRSGLSFPSRVKYTPPFELISPDAEWTIVGTSPLPKTYRPIQSFLDEVIHPFSARLRTPLLPAVRNVFADGDTVITLFDASATAADGLPYRNTYTWYFWMKDGNVNKAVAFFDTRDFDEFWLRVTPEK
jgi:uncharacterized protein